MFGVTSCKLLGFLVSEKGIELDPDKAKAVIKLPAPSNEKEVRGFIGRIQYVSRFISRLTSVCLPVLKLLQR